MSLAPLRLDEILRSVVSVTTVSDSPDYEQPWQTQGPSRFNGSGVIVETAHGLRVLTNAHCVENAVFVEVQRHGRPEKHVAEVDAIGHECDLAILSVPDEGFFADTPPIPLGELPHLGDRVQVCGFPIGGERISVTQGLVSRVEVVRYAQSQRRLLAIQIDAAINSGNSGGPVLRDGTLAGIAFQSLEGADRIAHAIAAPVVRHFLKDVEDGLYDGFPALGVVIQRLDAAAHRRRLALPPDHVGGVLVTEVVHESSADGVLRRGDVLLEVDGVRIESDATVPLREGELVGFDYLIAQKQVQDALSIAFWRDGALHRHTVTLTEPRYLVAEDRYDVLPSYYIFGGLLFVPLTRDYLKTWGPDFWHEAPRDLVLLYERGQRTAERTEPVVLQKVLADRVNQGYHDFGSLLVEAVDGAAPRSLRHLVEQIEAGQGEHVEIDVADGRRVVLDRREALERLPHVLERFGVPRDRSDDLLDGTPEAADP